MNIAIAGYGVEGESSYRYWSQDPSNHITIFNESQPEVEVPLDTNLIVGADAFQKMNGFDIIMRSASLAPRKIKTDGKIWSATNEFFAKCPAKIIGVTGTKGKGTTSSLIASILEADGKKVWLVGNIGEPALDYLPDIKPDDFVVYEMSSFQLWDLEKSPQIAVVLMIEPDHLNVHLDFSEYIDSKANICRYQTKDDICIYYSDNEYSKKVALTNKNNQKVRYGDKDDGGVYADGGWFYQNKQKICSVESLQLIGDHNIDNACAAISVAKFLGISNANIEAGLLKFQGLPHRLEFIRELNKAKYYNDSFSSAPGATVAAIKSFKQPEILILGGIDKGADFNNLIDTINNAKNIKQLILIGEIRHKLFDEISKNVDGISIDVLDNKDLKSIVNFAVTKSQAGDVVVLSPACASFDMFKNFYDRGNQFRNIVNSLDNE